MEQYVNEFVLCKECKKLDTKLIKEGRLTFINCLACGTKHSEVVKSGFVLGIATETNKYFSSINLSGKVFSELEKAKDKDFLFYDKIRWIILIVKEKSQSFR